MDEVGRGPLAGPLLACAVIFPADFTFVDAYPALAFRDSKKMSHAQRAAVVETIRQEALVVKIESISVDEINEMDIGWANRTVFERLIMEIEADRYVVDGRLKLANLGRRTEKVQTLIDADQIHQAVIAASIVAKVTRDAIMENLHAKIPIYGWDHNRGYGTSEHITALREHGASIHHRRKFVTTALSKYLNSTLDYGA
jgi:ribonuclease HII